MIRYNLISISAVFLIIDRLFLMLKATFFRGYQ